MKQEEKEHWLLEALTASVKAGEAIMRVYGTDFNVDSKSDRSPITEADRQAHQVIEDHLKASGIPMLSEEGKDIDYESRKSWSHYWLVDPLDGTKEFVKRNGEFTVNIALMENGRPAAGVIYVPVSRWLYFGDSRGAYKIQVENSSSFAPNSLFAKGIRLPEQEKSHYVVAGSRSHPSGKFLDYIAEAEVKHPGMQIVNRGSSLKFCLIAEGAADVYPRFGPTMEWDTGAGHAIVDAVGGRVVEMGSEEPLRYNKPDLHNPSFLAER